MCRLRGKVLSLKQLRCSVGWQLLVLKCYCKEQLKFNYFLKIHRQTKPLWFALLFFFFFPSKNLPAISKGFWSSFKTTTIWKCSLCSTTQGKRLFITWLLDSVISPKAFPLFFICETWNWPLLLIHHETRTWSLPIKHRVISDTHSLFDEFNPC